MYDTAFEGTVAHHECDHCGRINVIILYDRVDAGRRAMNKLRSVADNLPDDIELQVRVWRLDVLLESRGSSTAVTDLAAANLLLLALDDARGLDRGQLLEAVHQLRGLDAAVALLTHDDSHEAPSRFDFLRYAAEDAGIRSLFPPVRCAPARAGPAFTAIQGRATAMTPLLEGILNDIDSRPHRQACA